MANKVKEQIELNQEVREWLTSYPEKDYIVLVARPSTCKAKGRTYKRWLWNLHSHGKKRVHLDRDRRPVVLVRLTSDGSVMGIYLVPWSTCLDMKTIAVYGDGEGKLRKWRVG